MVKAGGKLHLVLRSMLCGDWRLPVPCVADALLMLLSYRTTACCGDLDADNCRMRFMTPLTSDFSRGAVHRSRSSSLVSLLPSLPSYLSDSEMRGLQSGHRPCVEPHPQQLAGYELSPVRNVSFKSGTSHDSGNFA